MLDLWWINTNSLKTINSWCEQRRDWLAKVPNNQQHWLSQLMRRELLARYLGSSAAELTFTTGEKGKPQLTQSTLQFNVSHAAGWHVLLLSDQPCGVDVEAWQRSINALRRPAIKRRFAEAAELDQLDDASLLRCWTMKEALAKCRGESIWQQLSQPLERYNDGWRAPQNVKSGHIDIGACVSWVAETDAPIRLHRFQLT